MLKMLGRLFLSSAILLTFESSVLAFGDDDNDDTSPNQATSVKVGTADTKLQDITGKSSTTSQALETSPLLTLIPDIKGQITHYLEIQDLGTFAQVSKGVKSYDCPEVWRGVMRRFLTDLSIPQPTKDDVKRSYLRVKLNLVTNYDHCEELFKLYEPCKLNKDLPFGEWRVLALIYSTIQERQDIYKDFKVLEDFKSLTFCWLKLSPSEQKGYEKDPQFREKLLDQALIHHSLDDVFNSVLAYYPVFRHGGWYDKESEELSVQLNEKLVKRGYLKAIDRKFEGLDSEKYGYQYDRQRAIDLNDQLIAQGDEAAMVRRITRDVILYPSNPQLEHDLNEQLVMQNNQEAKMRKVMGLSVGSYGYDSNLEEARDLNEELIALGNEEADTFKYRCLSGIYKDEKLPYSKDFTALNEHVNAEIEKEDEQAILSKAIWLYNGLYGNEKDLLRARQLFDKVIAKNEDYAMVYEVQAYKEGWYGHPQNIQKAINCNEELIKKNNRFAILLKIHDLLGKSEYIKMPDFQLQLYKLYPESIEGLRVFGKELIRDKSSMVYKLINEILENFKQTQSNLIEKLLKEWIEYAESLGERWAYYLKAQGLKYGVFGFEKNTKAAKVYILKNYIPY